MLFLSLLIIGELFFFQILRQGLSTGRTNKAVFIKRRKFLIRRKLFCLFRSPFILQTFLLRFISLNRSLRPLNVELAHPDLLSGLIKALMSRIFSIPDLSSLFLQLTIGHIINHPHIASDFQNPVIYPVKFFHSGICILILTLRICNLLPEIVCMKFFFRHVNVNHLFRYLINPGRDLHLLFLPGIQRLCVFLPDIVRRSLLQLRDQSRKPAVRLCDRNIRHIIHQTHQHRPLLFPRKRRKCLGISEQLEHLLFQQIRNVFLIVLF